MGMNPRLLRPRATGFDPRTIPGLALWLDGADASSVTLNGTNVSQWRDKSNNLRHFSQSTSGAQPAYTAAGQNGRNCLTFDGSRRLVSDSASSTWSFLHDGTSLYDIYVVWNTAAGSTALRTLMATGGSNRLLRSFYLWHDHRSGNNNQLYSEITTTSGNGYAAARAINNLSAGTTRLARVSVDLAAAVASRITMLVGSSTGTGDTFATGTAAAGDPSFNLTLGSLSATSSSFGLSGVLCEIIMFSRSTVLSTSERSSVSNYLTRKWGL